MKDCILDWKETLKTIRGQFEAKAKQSAGLYHLMTEVADDERDRSFGPGWFQPTDRSLNIVDGKPVYGTWDCSSFGSLPGIEPGFREIQPTEDISQFVERKLIRDRTGVPRALSTPMRLRWGFYCGPGADLVDSFKTLAATVTRTLVDVDLSSHPFATELNDLFRRPRGGVRYVFGEVADEPQQFIANGWRAGVLQYENGILIDVPIAESDPNEDHWLLLLHRLGWQKGLLQSERYYWDENSEIAFDLAQSPPRADSQISDFISAFSKNSFYSVIGRKDTPSDIFLASVHAIDLLIEDMAESRPANPGNEQVQVDYSGQPWSKQKIRNIKIRTLDDFGDLTLPSLGVLVATETERQAVLKRLLPLKGHRSISQVFSGANTFYLGRLGVTEVVLCMTAMGTASRDAATTITGELIRQWSLSGVIMVGICFGRDASTQRIGNVLISDRILPYEPQRISTNDIQDRGVQVAAGPILLNRFRNTVGWTFETPGGDRCGMQTGALLSGEKLVDNPDFKKMLFDRFPIAIGGEMEGSGVAAAAERQRCEWILVKAICDWGDGQKSKHHQEFAAASSVSLVEHVLNQPGAFESLGSK